MDNQMTLLKSKLDIKPCFLVHTLLFIKEYEDSFKHIF